MTKSIGIYHQIDLEILDLVASLRAEDADADEVNNEILRQGSQLGISEATIKKRTRPARKAWYSEDSLVVERAAQLFHQSDEDDRFALHVAVLIRAYPFFLDVLSEVGKALRLGSNVRQATIRDRLTRRYGQEGNVRQGVQKVLQSLVSWDKLELTAETGVYQVTEPRLVDEAVGEILVACILEGGNNDAFPLDAATAHPALFLFVISQLHIEENGLLMQYTEGGNSRFVGLNADVLSNEAEDPGSDNHQKNDSSNEHQRLDSFL